MMAERLFTRSGRPFSCSQLALLLCNVFRHEPANRRPHGSAGGVIQGFQNLNPGKDFRIIAMFKRSPHKLAGGSATQIRQSAQAANIFCISIIYLYF
jgi:hypothetical protein